jgi:hypothetical protein
MSPFQTAFDRIGAVRDELGIVQSTLLARWQNPSCLGSEKHSIGTALANSERTYLMRLLSEFEGVLTALGPNLSSPMSFGADQGLADKLNGIGKNMGVEAGFRKVMDRDIRSLRNDLLHGGLVPRIAFDDALGLMRQFLRCCR